MAAGNRDGAGKKGEPRYGSSVEAENRTDVYISTLRSYIHAMGGDLEIIAKFPDGAVKISNFTGIEEERPA